MHPGVCGWVPEGYHGAVVDLWVGAFLYGVFGCVPCAAELLLTVAAS